MQLRTCGYQYHHKKIIQEKMERFEQATKKAVTICNLRLAIDVFMAYPLEVFAFKLTILDSPDVSGVLCSEFNVIRQGSLI